MLIVDLFGGIELLYEDPKGFTEDFSQKTFELFMWSSTFDVKSGCIWSKEILDKITIDLFK